MQEDESKLSDRELEILQLVATGASNKEIANQLFISTNTVKVHLRNIFQKIDVTRRTEAALYVLNSRQLSKSEPGQNSTPEPIEKGDVSLTPSRAKRNNTAVWIIVSVFLIALAALRPDRQDLDYPTPRQRQVAAVSERAFCHPRHDQPTVTDAAAFQIVR